MHRNEEGELVFSPAEANEALTYIGEPGAPSAYCTFLSDAFTTGTPHDRDLLLEHAGTCQHCAQKVADHYRSSGTDGDAA